MKLFVLMFAIAVVAWLAYDSGFYPSSCTIGVTGTAAKINYRGFGAEQACRETMKAAGGAMYRVQDALTSAETVRCQREIPRGTDPRLSRIPGKVTATVTDTGFGLVAIPICQQLAALP